MTTPYQTELTPDDAAAAVRLHDWAKRRNNEPFTLHEVNQSRRLHPDFFRGVNAVRELFAELVDFHWIGTDDPDPENWDATETKFWMNRQIVRLDEPTYDDPILYRFHDVNGQLLYVHQTIDFASEIEHHELTNPWFTDVVNISMEQVPAAASNWLVAKAIRDEQPRYDR